MRPTLALLLALTCAAPGCAKKTNLSEASQKTSVDPRRGDLDKDEDIRDKRADDGDGDPKSDPCMGGE